MNATAAIAWAFLRGDVLTIKSAFKDFGISNLPRECGRSIERKFGVELYRVKREGKSKWGVPCIWYEYRLNHTSYNKEGIQKMKAYVQQHLSNTPKTELERTKFKQAKLFLESE